MYIYLKEKKKNRREVVMEWGEREKRPINGPTHPPRPNSPYPLPCSSLSLPNASLRPLARAAAPLRRAPAPPPPATSARRGGGRPASPAERSRGGVAGGSCQAGRRLAGGICFQASREQRSRRDLLPGGGRGEYAHDFLSPFSPLSFSARLEARLPP
jgi:hypothetical protein